MNWSSNRLEISSARPLRAVISLGLATLLGLASCSDAHEDGSPDNADESSVVVPSTALFKSIDVETLLGQDDTRSVTDKIRSGTPIDYDQTVGNAVVWTWSLNAGGSTAQVVNRWLLLINANWAVHLINSGVTTMTVKFTDDAGNVNDVYSGPVKFSAGSSFGLILLVNGMSTCHEEHSVCSTMQKNIPENAVFQFFVEGLPIPTASQYTIVGYGPTSHNAVDMGILRSGTMPYVSSAWGGTGTGRFLRITTSWGFNMARTCRYDDGGPLIPFIQNRILHTGVGMPSSTTCDASSGTRQFNALSDSAVLAWFKNSVVAFMAQHPNVKFGCASGINETTGLAAFHCDNDGALYGIQ